MRMRSRYGKKGGTSANAGRKATKYTVPMPDGRTLTKRVFQDCGASASALIYEHDGEWFLNTVVPTHNKPGWAASYTEVPAERIENGAA